MKTNVVVMSAVILVIGFMGISSRWADEIVVMGGNDVPAIPPGSGKKPVTRESATCATQPAVRGQDWIVVTGGNDTPAIPPGQRHRTED